MPRPRTVLAALALVALSTAGAASAARPPTGDEQAAVAAFAGTTVACVDVTVSTVDPDWLDYASTHADGCPQADGVAVLHRTGGALTDVTEGSDFGVCPVDGVPTDVALDLQLCVQPSKEVFLARPVSTRTTVSTVRPPKVFARTHAYYKALRWTRWGAKTATARGTLDYYAKAKFKAPVVLTVSRLQICGANRRTYTRIAMRFVHASDRRAHGFLEGAKTYPCPID